MTRGSINACRPPSQLGTASLPLHGPRHRHSIVTAARPSSQARHRYRCTALVTGTASLPLHGPRHRHCIITPAQALHHYPCTAPVTGTASLPLHGPPSQALHHYLRTISYELWFHTSNMKISHGCVRLAVYLKGF